jgi:hypothetical protein
MRVTLPNGLYRAYFTIVGGAAVIAAASAVFAALLATESVAAPATTPSSTGEPRITGSPMVAEILSATNGTWSGTEPFEFTFRWVRCDASGSRPDGSDCTPISQATRRTYEVRGADVGFRLRVRVTATNIDGAATVASNPTAIVMAARPSNTDRPSISGAPVFGSRLQANRGGWTGIQPITYSYRWLRCNPLGDNCSEISGASDSEYVLVDADVGRTVRVRVTARNDAGTTTAVSPQSGTVQARPSPTPGSTIPVGEVPATARLIASEVRFSPNPVTSRTDPITVRIRVKDTRGFVIQGALVFIRSTPRVTSGADRQATDADGWLTYRLVPNQNFRVRTGYNVQFFVKAFRAGDPPLAGIAGYRLVQVRTASA